MVKEFRLIFAKQLMPRYKVTYLLLLMGMLFVIKTSHAQWKIVANGFEGKEIETATYQNKTLALNAVYNHYSHLLGSGFLDAKIDTAIIDSTIHISIEKGLRYTLTNIHWETDSLTPLFAQNRTFRKPKSIDLASLNKEITRVLAQYENRGFPFAAITVIGLNMEQGETDINLNIDKGPQILLDSLIIRSEEKIPQRYVRNYLDIMKGDYYNEAKLKGLDKKLREIPFVQLTGPSEIGFKPGEADVYLFLKRKKASYFNGILGVRPDDLTGKINITGDAEIKLINAFNSGEDIYINWRKMQSQTQDLTVKTTLPYLFSSPIGIDGQLKIYKRDSTFVSLKAAFGLVFAFSGNNQIRAFVERNTTSQLATYFSSLPLADVNSTLYGISSHFERLDYRFNPRKGYQTSLQLATGFRNVNKKLSNELQLDMNGRYNLYRIEGDGEYFIPTFKKQTIRLGIQGATFISKAIYDNEMYRIGGLRTIRGVDEESIYATSWLTGSLEYRLLFEENASVYIFVDQSWYEKNSIGNYTTDTPIGFGAGVNFETGAGIFTFNYALGQQFDNPILIRNAKISFGFKSIF